MLIALGFLQVLWILLMYVIIRSRREMFLLHLRSVTVEDEILAARVRPASMFSFVRLPTRTIYRYRLSVCARSGSGLPSEAVTLYLCT